MNTDSSPIILAIETSCDETAAAVVLLESGTPVVRSSVVSSQVELHREYGGVVPNLAAREHVRNLVPVIDEAMREANVSPDDIDAIAVTQGPGLIPALLAGVAAAKTLALVWAKPLLGIHHIEGHVYANFVRELTTDNPQPSTEEFPVSRKSIKSTAFAEGSGEARKVKSREPGSETSSPAGGEEPEGWRGGSPFPILALVVSGGHTELVLMRDHFEYEILGRTKDDAAGEAFDKVAKMLGLPYPGGPEVAARAERVESRKSKVKSHDPKSENGIEQTASVSKFEIRNSKLEEASGFRFPRPMIDSSDYDFSFSGLKTAVLYEIRKVPEAKRDEIFINDICHAFQEAVVETLTAKTRRAVLEFAPRTLVVAGGVSANVALRKSLASMVADEFPETEFLMPEFKYSLDNAAMIGAAATFRYAHLSPKEREEAKRAPITLEPDANLPLSPQKPIKRSNK